MEKIKLRIWDSKLLNEAYLIATQMRIQIEILMQQSMQNGVVQLPHSMVPSDTLYELVLCNEMMYNLLIDKELIDTGNKKTDRTKIH
jgi:hypothetical protein